ncbi:MAG: molybdate ABC transporter substrate-binding protein [Deltaproteobacteria bacterium]|nr:molybdate ABC transporter substrate-binding protein [Deltaproteobacteria bacterium]
MLCRVSHSALVGAGLLLACLMASCGGQETSSGEAQTDTLRVVAASSLRFALPDVLSEWRRRRPGLDVEVSYTSSGQAFAQLGQGAPFDLFLSADRRFPERLVEGGVASRESLFVYARGQLALYTERDLGLASTGVEGLRAASISHIAIANPEHAPYGRAAIASLRTLGVLDAVEAKLVQGESVGQAANLVAGGAADVGIIALSLTRAPSMRGGYILTLPVESYPALWQAGVVIQASPHRAAAEELRALLLSPRGQSTLSRWGLLPAPEG